MKGAGYRVVRVCETHFVSLFISIGCNFINWIDDNIKTAIKDFHALKLSKENIHKYLGIQNKNK